MSSHSRASDSTSAPYTSFIASFVMPPSPRMDAREVWSKCSAGVAVPKQKQCRSQLKGVHSERPHRVPVAKIYRLGKGFRGYDMRLERLRSADRVDGFRGDCVLVSVGQHRGAQRKPKEKGTESERGRG